MLHIFQLLTQFERLASSKYFLRLPICFRVSQIRMLYRNQCDTLSELQVFSISFNIETPHSEFCFSESSLGPDHFAVFDLPIERNSHRIKNIHPQLSRQQMYLRTALEVTQKAGHTTGGRTSASLPIPSLSHRYLLHTDNIHRVAEFRSGESLHVSCSGETGCGVSLPMWGICTCAPWWGGPSDRRTD